MLLRINVFGEQLLQLGARKKEKALFYCIYFEFIEEFNRI
jgi:hypothetical protein